MVALQSKLLDDQSLSTRNTIQPSETHYRGSTMVKIYTMWCPRLIAKLAYHSNVTMVYDTYHYSIHGANKQTNITGGPHIVGDCNV